MERRKWQALRKNYWKNQRRSVEGQSDIREDRFDIDENWALEKMMEENKYIAKFKSKNKRKLRYLTQI